MTMMRPEPRLMDDSVAGFWRVLVYPYGNRGSSALDVTFVRGAPTLVESLETSDPFGPTTATLAFPSITMLDRLGAGDIPWCGPETDVDICWFTPYSDTPMYRWEGYFASFDFSASGSESMLTVTCRGAMFQVDNWLAKPEYVYQPIPYEVAISRAFSQVADSRLSALSVEWPSWWRKTFSLEDYADQPLYLRPVGVEDGANWSGYITRSTGSFDPSLTGYIQGLLANMHTEFGQFTVTLDQGRRPVLRHRDRGTTPTQDTLVIDALQPGVDMNFTRDFTQQLNVVYGQGKSINGSTFSGMKVSADGTRITYEPYAYRREVYPTDMNDWYDRSVMRKEVSLSFFEGVSEDEAQQIARSHLQRFSDPGITGSITLSSSAQYENGYLPWFLITAGRTILVKGLFGVPEGVLFHITEASVSEGSVSLTVDSKFRDQLTVQEVRMRTRDSLAPIRLLTVGQFKPNIPDMLFPWSYSDGSGFMPKAAKDLFSGMPSGVTFPWTDWTRQRPPSDPKWAQCYVRIGPASTNADENWANARQSLSDFQPIPIRMSQAGEVSLIQVAAFDRNGNILQVPFHVSFYKTNGTSYTSMPMLTMDEEQDYPPFKAGQHYPFFKQAWEEFTPDGQKVNTETVQAVPTAQILAGYGNYYEKAGYWPSSSTVPTSSPTGLFSDSSGFSWDLTDAVYGVDPQRSAQENLADPNRADIQAMIYCDAQGTQEVFFLARIFRKEPGTA
jgi:hypothetical protein